MGKVNDGHVQDATELLAWIIEQSENDRGEMAYLAEQATEEASGLLAEALTS